MGISHLHIRRLALGALLGLALAGTAAAQSRLAFVVGNDPAATGQPQRDAIAVSQRLLALGFDVVRRENVTSGSLNLMRQRAAEIVLFYSGPVSVDDQTGLMLADWALRDVVDSWRARGADRVMVFVQGCYGGEAAMVPAPDLVAQTQSGVFIATSHDPSIDCAEAEQARFTDRLTVALALTDTAFSAALEAVGIAHVAGQAVEALVQSRPLQRLPRSVEQALSRLEPAIQQSLTERFAARNVVVGLRADPDPTQAAGSAGGTVISLSPLRPAASGGVTIMQPSQPATAVALRNVQLVAVPQSAALPAALPQAAGLPVPLIRVGRIAPTEASFEPAEQLDVLNGEAIDPTSFEARQQLRARDPEQFAALLARGLFDPSEAALVTELQRELARMNCYTGGIDGDWGPGSRAGVARYRDAADLGAGDDAPSIGLFREVALENEVTCPVVVQAAAPRAQPTATTTQRRATTQAPRPAATPAPAAQSAPSGGLNTNNLGTGVFR